MEDYKIIKPDELDDVTGGYYGIDKSEYPLCTKCWKTMGFLVEGPRNFKFICYNQNCSEYYFKDK